MSTYKINVEDLSNVVANGYKDIIESTLRIAIKKHTDSIIEEAVKRLAQQIDAGVNSYYQVEKNNIVLEMYIDKSKVDWKEK